MDDDYEELGLADPDYFLPGVDLTLWLRLILATVTTLLLAAVVVLKT